MTRRLNSGNAYHYSVQNLLSSRLMSKSLKIRIYENIILPVVLYGCERRSLTLRKEHGLRVFEKRILRKMKEDSVSLTGFVWIKIDSGGELM
jgi:hypothetical protein